MRVVSMLGGYRARIRRTLRRRYLAMSALGVGIAWLIAAGVHYFDLPVPGTLPLAIAITFLLPITALIVEAICRPSISETAALLDRRLDNSQRLITSIELMSKGEGLPSPLTDAQIATSAEMLGRVQPKAVYPARTPWNMVVVGGGLLLLALSLFILKGGGFTPFSVGTLPPDQPVVASLAAPTPDAGIPPSEVTPEATPTSNPTEVAVDEDQQPSDRTGGISTAVPPSADPKEQAEASQQAASDLANLERALDGQGATQQAADALKQGNVDEAAQQITDLGKENDQVSEEAKEGLADALEQAARDTSTNPSLQKAEEEAAKALRDGDYKAINEALENLAGAMQQTASNITSQEDLASSFPEQPTQTPGDQAAQPTDPSDVDGQEGDQPGESGEQGNSQGQQGGTDSGQQGEGEGEQSGEGAGSKPESGEGEGQGGAPGQGTRVNGPKDTSDLDVPGNPFELGAKPDPGNTSPQSDPEQQHPGITLDGGSGGSGAAPVTPGDAINLPGETSSLPLDRLELIRKFFSP
jgi:hypothetical protein